MPECAVCGRSYPNKGDLKLLRNPDGQWVLTCHVCGGDEEGGEKKKGASTKIQIVNVDRAKRARGSGSSTVIQEREDLAFALLQERLDEFRAIRQEQEEEEEESLRARDQKRAYDRRETNLPMEFSFLRDHAIYEARVHDISQGGIRFMTRQEVRSGQVLQIVIHAQEAGGGKGQQIRNLAELRRVTTTEGGEFEAGARFIRRAGIETKNRRKFARRATSIPVFYRREGSTFVAKARAVDIGQGGIRLHADEAMEIGETVEIWSRTEPPSFVAADLRGTVRVVRTAEQSHNCVEIGCAFHRLRVQPLDPRAAAGAGEEKMLLGEIGIEEPDDA